MAVAEPHGISVQLGRPHPGRAEGWHRSGTLAWTAISLLLILAWARPDVWHPLHAAFPRIHLGLIRDLIIRWGPWAPVASVLLMVGHTFVPFPAEIMIAANGAVFGFWVGLLVSWIGAIASACIPFGLARVLGGAGTVRIIPREPLEWVDGMVTRGDWTVALVVRFIPLFPFSLFNFALGRTPLSWTTFLWTTGVGIVPATAAAVGAGYGAADAPGVLPWALGGWSGLTALGMIFRHRIVPPTAHRASRGRPRRIP